MAKIIDKIVQSATEPSKNDLWLHEGSLKANLKGKWESIGGGSGGGVTIVDSVDKLDPNAPVGSIAVISSGEPAKETRIEDLYKLGEDDLIIDQANKTVTIKDPEKFNLVSEIKIHLPKNPLQPVAGSMDGIIVGGPEFLSYLASGGKEYKTGCVFMFSASDNVITDIQCQGVTESGDSAMFNLITISTEEEGIPQYILNDEDVQAFTAFFKSIKEPMLYLGSLMFTYGVSSDLSFANEFITISSGSFIDSKVFIRNNNWEELYSTKFEYLQNAIDRKPNPIVMNTLSSASQHEIEAQTYNFTNIYEDTTFKLKGSSTPSYRYEEYVLELYINIDNPALTFVDDNDEELSILWANGIAPSFEKTDHCVISLASGLGVFLKF